MLYDISVRGCNESTTKDVVKLISFLSAFSSVEGAKKCPFLNGKNLVKQASREVQEDVIDLSAREQGKD